MGRRSVSPMRVLLMVLCVLVMTGTIGAMPVWAQSRASLDRDRIAIDETVTLTLEIDPGSARGLPDLMPLTRDFRIVDQNAQQQVSMVNGDVSLQVTLQLTLAPLHEGDIQIPALRIGKELTRPLRLTVVPSSHAQASPSPVSAGAGQGGVFIESRADSLTPYVQQSVGYTVWLYYELGTILEGRLDQDPPEGASLQKIGDDLQSTRRIGNRDYRVVERRFLLIPERSGKVAIPPARFMGSGLGLFDSLFNSNRQELRVRGREVTLEVKPIPANARQPWLPLRNLSLRYLDTPRAMRVGESARITVEAVAEGATAAQLPVLLLETGKDAQVFADTVQQDERFEQGRPQATLRRRFSILPGGEGTLRIAGPRIEWWDTEAGIARVASLPDLIVPVAPGAAGVAAPSGNRDAATQADDGERAGSPAWFPSGRWFWASLALALLWLGVSAWAWRIWTARRRSVEAAHAPSRQPSTRLPGSPPASPRASSPGSLSGAVATGTAKPDIPAIRTDPQAWAAALARSNPGEIERMLCAMASPPAADLHAVRTQLADPAQRAAIDTLERARWGDGDNTVAFAALRAAFAAGPRWRATPVRTAPSLLPPLYPEG